MKKITIIINGMFFDASIGSNENENDRLVRESAQNDLWFHLKDLSGPHIVLHCGNSGISVPKRTLNEIASLFRTYKNGLGRSYKVIYTEIKNVRLTKIAGSVFVTNTNIIRC